MSQEKKTAIILDYVAAAIAITGCFLMLIMCVVLLACFASTAIGVLFYDHKALAAIVGIFAVLGIWFWAMNRVITKDKSEDAP